MIQQHETHPAGTFPICSGCRREPAHIITRGRSAREVIDIRNPPATRHHLECCRCGRTTAKYPVLAAATKEWGEAYAQSEFVFPLRRRRA